MPSCRDSALSLVFWSALSYGSAWKAGSLSAPAGLWVAQGAFYAVCVLIASMIDGLIRPWRNRLRNTVLFAAVIVAWWGSAAIGYAIAGDKADTVGWLVAFLVFVVMGWALRKGRYRHPNPRRSDTHD